MKLQCPKCGSAVESTGASATCVQCRSTFVASEAKTATQAPPVDPLVGRVLGGCRLLERIGAGGMGVVYRAEQVSLLREVAVKLLPEGLRSEDQIEERFRREIAILAKLNHPNIVHILDGGVSDVGAYFVMEYVDGVSLRKVFANGGVNTLEALRIVPQICSALEYAHLRGIVHRDIKPENILLDRDGRVRLLDFGLSRLVEGEQTTHVTRTTQVLGTFEYMAPEQREGSKAVDHRSDLYSLGVVIYEMLTGELPIGRFDPPSKRNVQVDVRLDEVVLRVLDKKPERRYQSATEIKTEIERISTSEPPVVVQMRSQGSGPGPANPRASSIPTPPVAYSPPPRRAARESFAEPIPSAAGSGSTPAPSERASALGASEAPPLFRRSLPIPLIWVGLMVVGIVGFSEGHLLTLVPALALLLGFGDYLHREPSRRFQVLLWVFACVLGIVGFADGVAWISWAMIGALWFSVHMLSGILKPKHEIPVWAGLFVLFLVCMAEREFTPALVLGAVTVFGLRLLYRTDRGPLFHPGPERATARGTPDPDSFVGESAIPRGAPASARSSAHGERPTPAPAATAWAQTPSTSFDARPFAERPSTSFDSRPSTDSRGDAPVPASTLPYPPEIHVPPRPRASRLATASLLLALLGLGLTVVALVLALGLSGP